MTSQSLKARIEGLGREARAASRHVARASTAAKNQALLLSAAALRRDQAALLEANQADLASARAAGQDAAFLDRLTLSPAAVESMAAGLVQIATLQDPVGEVAGLAGRPSGIEVGRMRVPLGVIAIIYEARPNVTADAAALCLKSGNACILRGGSEALGSNQIIARAMHEGLKGAGLPASAIQVLDITDRAAVGELIPLKGLVDVFVPR